MRKNPVISKVSRIAGAAAILGTTAALLFVGAPADASVVQQQLFSTGIKIAASTGI